MFTLIKAARLFRPEPFGTGDILIAGKTIARIASHIDLPDDFETTIISAAGKTVVPGFIDLHVHILGGGGEGGFGSRTPEITLSRIARAGVTTVVGCLGTDDVTRRPETLLAKAMQLEEEGISTYIYTGSYQFPPPTITGSVRKDVALIPKVIGVGEIAISDHRSSQPSFEELSRIAAEARVGGMIGGKAGLVHLHVGSGPGMLDPLLRVVKETDIPIGQFLPTHITRTEPLLEEALNFAAMGGNIDFTVGAKNLGFASDVGNAVLNALARGIPVDRITLSSDANGSLPLFDAAGNFIRLAVGDIINLFKAFKGLVKSGLPIEDALKLVTENAARRVGIAKNKGRIAEGHEADLVILGPDLTIESVMAKGRLLVHNGEALVKGTFED
jgi:beta-aspartyl-dipeptidase (metallo-type)